MELLTTAEVQQVSGAGFQAVGIKLIDWAISGAAWEALGWAVTQPPRTSSGGQMNSAHRSNMYN